MSNYKFSGVKPERVFAYLKGGNYYPITHGTIDKIRKLRREIPFILFDENNQTLMYPTRILRQRDLVAWNY